MVSEGKSISWVLHAAIKSNCYYAHHKNLLPSKPSVAGKAPEYGSCMRVLCFILSNQFCFATIQADIETFIIVFPLFHFEAKTQAGLGSITFCILQLLLHSLSQANITITIAFVHPQVHYYDYYFDLQSQVLVLLLLLIYICMSLLLLLLLDPIIILNYCFPLWNVMAL